MDKIIKSVIIIIFLSVFSSFCLAQEQGAEAQAVAQEKPGWLKSVEVLSGFSRAKLTHGQGNYYLAPIIIDLNLDLKPAISKIGINSAGSVDFGIEPFVNIGYHPDSSVEAGTAFMFKVGLVPESWKFQPFARVGAGMVYMSQKTDEQSTKFNFVEQGGLGAHYFFNKNFALTGECRIRHLSNNGIKEPNHGINNLFFLLGAAYQFN